MTVASAGLYASLHLIPDNHANIPPLSCYRPDALPATQPTASKHLPHFLYFADVCLLETATATTSVQRPFFHKNLGKPAAKRSIILDFNEAKNDGVVVASAGLSIYKSIAPRSRQITMPVPHHLSLYRPDALPAIQPTASKH